MYPAVNLTNTSFHVLNSFTSKDGFLEDLAPGSKRKFCVHFHFHLH
jgi:hypothetical protein